MASKYSLYIYPQAAKDMASIFDYIANELKNPDAAIKQIDDFESCSIPFALLRYRVRSYTTSL